jgi:microsomal dipeptidase-like Zn-dependent dipeptidase
LQASELHEQLIVIDGLQAQNPHWERPYLEDLRAGGVTAVNATLSIWEGSRETMNHIARFHRRIRENSDLLRLALTTEDIRAAKSERRTAILMGFQDTSPLEDDIDLVEIYWRLGIRIIQLTYNTQNSVGAGCWELDDPGLSSHIGRSFVRELNEFGILIDVSHSSNKTVLDTIETSAQPIAITHGNPHSFVGDDVELPRRNRSDEVLRELAQAGGVIGLSTYPKIAPDGPSCTIERWSEMVEYCAEMIGIDHVGFGTDFCQGSPRDYIMWCRTGSWSRESAVPLSTSTFPSWMSSAGDIPRFTQGLLDRGFSEEDVRKVMGGNFLRVLSQTIDQPQCERDQSLATIA